MQQPQTTTTSRSRAGWWLLAALSVAFVLIATLAPQASQRQANWAPLSQSGPAFRALLRSSDPLGHPAFRFLLWQVVGNIVAFIPVGFSFAALAKPQGRWPVALRAVLAAFLLSVVIETIQLTLPTRATDVDDLIFNTFGALLGVLALVWWRRRRRRNLEPT